MAKIVNLPAATDDQGNELSLTQLEEISQEPAYAPVEIEVNGKTVNASVALDFDQVGRDEDKAYQFFKSKQFKVQAGQEPTQRNGKFTNIPKPEEVSEEDEGMRRLTRMMELNAEGSEVFLNILFPKGHKENPVILGHNVPSMPQAYEEMEAWLRKGGKTAKVVIESIITFYDPTSLLAIVRNAMRKMMVASENAIEGMDEAEATTDETESLDQMETGSLEGKLDGTLDDLDSGNESEKLESESLQTAETDETETDQSLDQAESTETTQS